MALYKTHTKFNFFVCLPLFLVGLIYFFTPSTKFILSFLICFCYSTLFMSPDVDISCKVKLFSIKGFLTIPFRAYSKIFRHRGISHMIILGTLTRIFFLALFFLLLSFIFDNFDFSMSHIQSFYGRYKEYILYGLLGIVLADCSHIFLDAFSH